VITLYGCRDSIILQGQRDVGLLVERRVGEGEERRRGRREEVRREE